MTPRGREVADLLVLGLTDREIAHRLGISPWTVVKHVRRVVAELGASGRTEAAVLWDRRRRPGG